MPKETHSIKGVEIFSVGKWNGHEITEKDIDTIIETFESNKETIKPFLKLGHDDKQELLQKDGYPAAGYVSSLRKVGKKLVADFESIPKKIFELIKLGAYKKVSCEIYSNIDICGKIYKKMLSAVSLLGANMPAVLNLSDVLALYNITQNEGSEIQTIEYTINQGEENMDKFASRLGDFLRAELDKKEGATVADLGRAGGVSESTMQQILGGSIEAPPENRLKGFAQFLGVSLDALKNLIPSDRREDSILDEEEKEKMEFEKTQKELEETKTSLETANTELDDAKKELEDLKEFKAKAEAEILEAKKKEDAAELDKYIAELKGEELTTPATEKMVKELVGEQKEEYSIEDKAFSQRELVKELLKLTKESFKVNTAEKTEDGKADKSEDKDEKLLADIRKFQADNKCSFSVAYKEVMNKLEKEL